MRDYANEKRKNKFKNQVKLENYWKRSYMLRRGNLIN